MHGKLIKEILIKYKLTQQQLADELSYKKDFISDIARNKSNIPKSKHIVFIEKYKVNPIYLLTGKGEMFSNNMPESDCISLPLITASAGGGYELFDNITVSVPRTELINLGCLKKENLVVVKIAGCSMQPTINDGDMLILDKNIKTLYDNNIYVLNYNGELFCKRILQGLTYIKLKSDNPEYDIEKIEGQEQNKLNIIGRVVYRMNSF